MSTRGWRHSEAGRQYFRDYYHSHKVARRLSMKRYHTKIKQEVLIHYGNSNCTCVRCGENRLACLSINHVEGGGTEHRETAGHGNNLYLWLRRRGYPKGYQTLCMNCQYVKREEEHECSRT